MAVSSVFINFFPKIVFNKILQLKIDSVLCTESHGQHTKYVSFPWPPEVARHVRKRLAGAMHISGSYWL
jgi:hypothetical protein